MNSALRSSAIEILMLVLFIAWGAIFGASLLHPGAAPEGRAAGSSEQRVQQLTHHRNA